MNYPALSVRAPWAWLIVHGHKPIENRTWSAEFRGRLFIHVGKTWKAEEKSDLALIREKFPEIQLPSSFDLGGIIGEVEMVGCITQSSSPWFNGPYGFVFKDPKPLPFIPCRGMQGFFNIPAAMLDAGPAGRPSGRHEPFSLADDRVKSST